MRALQTLVSQARAVEAGASFGVLSTGEQCEVALILDRLSFLPDWTALEMIDRAVAGGADVGTLIAAQRALGVRP